MSGHPAVAGQFARSGTYVDTAGYGLAPAASVSAMAQAIEDWRTGAARWPSDWDVVGEPCRALLASIVGVRAEEVALSPAVSVGAAVVASMLEPGDEVLVPEDEFSSVLMPLLAVARDRRLRIRRVPYRALIDELTPRTALVAVSHVRSNGGGMIDLDALSDAAHVTNTPILLDATHSAGVLEIAAGRRGIDFVLAAGYKHLLCPRGVALMAVAERWWERLAPLCSGWRAQADPYSNYFGGDLTKLASTAARFDVSLAWFSWIGARPALELLDSVPTPERERWCVDLANAFADAVGVEPTGSSVIGVPVAYDRETVVRKLDEARVRATCGDGTVRVSFHLYNDQDDVERAAAALKPLLAR